MADQEFERIIQEGMAALNKSRERLRADRDKPPDWEWAVPHLIKGMCDERNRRTEG
jgi:hypothetical protein